MTMNEYHRAKWWRKARGLSVAALAELTGYSPEAVYRFERGLNSEGKAHKATTWRRYKIMCATVALKPVSEFDWQTE